MACVLETLLAQLQPFTDPNSGSVLAQLA